MASTNAENNPPRRSLQLNISSLPSASKQEKPLPPLPPLPPIPSRQGSASNNNFIRKVLVRRTTSSASAESEPLSRTSSTYQETEYTRRGRANEFASPPRYVSRFIEHLSDDEEDTGDTIQGDNGGEGTSNEGPVVENMERSSPKDSGSTINSGGKSSTGSSRRSEILRKAASKVAKLFRSA